MRLVLRPAYSEGTPTPTPSPNDQPRPLSWLPRTASRGGWAEEAALVGIQGVDEKFERLRRGVSLGQVSSSRLFTATPTLMPTPSASLTAFSSPLLSTTVLPSTPAPTSTPIALPFYCFPANEFDIIFLISASGQTGANTFYSFTNLAANLISALPMGTDCMR